jgi:hypothetical protein
MIDEHINNGHRTDCLKPEALPTTSSLFNPKPSRQSTMMVLFATPCNHQPSSGLLGLAALLILSPSEEI